MRLASYPQALVFGKREHVSLSGTQGTPRTQIMGLISLRILYILSGLLVWVALGSVSRLETGKVSKLYIPEGREKQERNLPWFRQNQNSATRSFLQHHMLLLCSIKRGSQVRKRGRRQWLSILEKQPGLVTSRDQVLKQMGSDLLAVLLRPHVPLRILGVDSLTPLYPKLQLITVFPTELVFMKQPCLSLVNIIKEGWVPSLTWRIFISWRIAMMNGNPSWLLGFPGAPLWLVGDRSRHTWRSPDGRMGTYLNAHLKSYFPVVIWRRKRRRTTRTALAQLALNTFLPGPALSFSQKRKVVGGM